MSRVATYVFLDLETTGLPKEELNKTKITELSLVAVKREHLLATRPGATPRVQHKLTLCLNPCRTVSSVATETTGLCNDLLEHEPVFNHEVFNMINTFLNVFTKPVCLIAQNGLGFDYPILKRQLVKLNVSFSEDLLCADCYHGFYDILEEKKELENNCDLKKSDSISSLSLQKNDKLELPNNKAKSQYGAIEKSPTNSNTSINASDVNDFPNEFISFNDSPYSCKLSLENNLAMQAINETTPKRQKIEPTLSRMSKARRRMPWGSGRKPSISYKLKDIYERVLNRASIEAHRAEHDCILALEVSAALSHKFVEWVDNNYVLFTDITPMTIGVRL